MTIRAVLFLAAAAAATFAGAPAGAQDAKPTPTACAGMTFTDPPGDQSLGAAGLSTGARTQANLDITGGFFRYAPQGGKNVMTANIIISDLNDAVTPGSTGHTYYFYFNLGEDIYFVNANLSSSGWTFHTGDLGVTGTGNAETGDTTGKIYPGKDGIISIVFPVNVFKVEGKTLGTPRASSRVAFSTPAGGLVPTADDGPDNQEGKDFRVSPCADGTTPTPGGGTGDPGTGTNPGSGGGGGTGSTPPSGTPKSGPATLPVTVTAGKQSAKKISKKRKLTVGLSSSERITALTAKLLKGKKTVASGKLASLAGKGKLTLRSKSKRFKAGTYVLRLAGKNAQGQSASAQVTIKVRK